MRARTETGHLDRRLTLLSALLDRFQSGELRWQLTQRLLGVFVLVAFTGSLLALTSYEIVVRRAERAEADNVARYVDYNFHQLQGQWARNAQEVRSHIDFMRLFGNNGNSSWLRLKAYFASLEGGVGKFTSGTVIGADRVAKLSFGYDGANLARKLPDTITSDSWIYGEEHMTAYALISVPLWLGSEGRGHMVLMQPLDAGVLRDLAPPDVRLFLALDGKIVASSLGSEGEGPSVDATFSGRLKGTGAGLEQRVVRVFGDDPKAPVLVMQQTMRDALSPLAILLGSTALLSLLTVVLWLVVGRWAARVADRVAQLSHATNLFAQEHSMTPALRDSLDFADSQSQQDEIGQVARSSRALMQSILKYDKEHFAYLQTLDILEEGVVEVLHDGSYAHASPGWFRLIGETNLQAHGLLFDKIHPEDVGLLRTQLAQLFSAEKSSLSGRIRLRREDTKDAWIEYRFVPGEASDGRIASVRGVLRDITQSYQLEKHITHMALHDALTELPNRVLLEDRTKIALRMAERNGNQVAIGFLDLDHFKLVNDQHGHKVGDQMLVTLARNLRQSLRNGDTLARWGGDEFIVLLPDLAHIDAAREVMAKLAATCQKALLIDGNEFNVTFSMGVALYPDDAQSSETLLAQADRAMFFAKEQGRNTVCFFNDMAHQEQDRKALYIQNRLATAIREQKIRTWFQPIVDAHTHQVVGCEALARWNDETYGWVSPATFIPMAENLGLIREIGHQVWTQAVEAQYRWRQLGVEIRVSVNVSRRQLFSPNFTSDLLDDLEILSIPVSLIDLEITESVAMDEAEHTTKRLLELTASGFGIAIDDFGTGYSSLSQLHDMPASKLKIDISFVRRADTEQGAQLVQAIVKIAKAFGLTTVAEGVEDQASADRMLNLGVDLLQGYHFGKPMSAQDFEAYLRDGPIAAPPAGTPPSVPSPGAG